MMSNAIIFVGNTGVGKSYLCNKILELCDNDTRFATGSTTNTVTMAVQSADVNYKNKTYAIVDTPGFFGTVNADDPDLDGKNTCKLVETIQRCDQINAIVVVFTDRFSTPHKFWFERMVTMIKKNDQAHIILLHNKQSEYNETEFYQNRTDIGLKLDGNINHDYFWMCYHPEQTQITRLMDTIGAKPAFVVNKIVVPEIVYKCEERGPPYEEVISNTSDEGHRETLIRDNSHYETKQVWDRGTGNLFGELGMRFMGKRNELVWVTSETEETIWVPKMVTRRTITTYQDLFKVRFDATKDLHHKVELNSKQEQL